MKIKIDITRVFQYVGLSVCFAPLLILIALLLCILAAINPVVFLSILSIIGCMIYFTASELRK